MSEAVVRTSAYDDPHAVALIAQVQAEYVQMYGGPDTAPVDPAEFAAPNGTFLVAYDPDDVPVAMGGWRRHDSADTSWASPAAEIKRMYVAPQARGRGLARLVLAELERTAAQDGIHWLLLETGSRQPAAIALYRSAGYADVPPFGHYAETELSVHLGKRLTSD
jgi:GNAT superfamily N-acetyltransferase